MRSGSRLFYSAALSGTLCFTVSWPAVAQLASGSISGTVKDSTGAVAPNAQVAIRNVETGIARTVQTDSGGRYVGANLAPGSYEVEAQLGGFQREVRNGITVSRLRIVTSQPIDST